MSRQRPYETFEKAFFNYLMKNEGSRDSLYALLKELLFFEHNNDPGENVSMHIPVGFLARKDISILWSCLSRLFGEQDPEYFFECKISRKYIPDVIEYIEDRIAEIVEDEQIEEMLNRGVKND